ncbi:golgin candidate 1 isoform X1 [Cinnamomum micranthum f. kanehirae]|uniref:Golgin candidate 1 isoform X1 n=1 Tax=Cinnamomum micranthum f. kanehirae TaxID=337451 RepID=A0A3S3PTC9_9MAGN|nr:golgin candidate 1 isoform X1 [Cinnamomum micranthum f. kanehirae]
MSSWLKVAEDLLEVVDRRAKLVVSELADEQAESQPLASNGKELHARRRKSNDKGYLRQSDNEPPKTNNVEREQEQTIMQPEASTMASDNDDNLSSEGAGSAASNFTSQASMDFQSNANKDVEMSGPSLWATSNDIGEHDSDIVVEGSATEDDIKPVPSSTNGDVSNEGSTDRPERSSSSPFFGTEVEFTNGHYSVPAEGDPKVKVVDEESSLKTDQQKPESEIVETNTNVDVQEKDVVLQEPLLNPKKQEEHRIDSNSMRVQDQLEEAQGLLKSAISTGQSKEARLARVCAGLSSRLQVYKSENSQLEELLVSERERSNSYEARIKQLQQDLSISKSSVSKIESDMADALVAKNSEIEALVTSMDALKKQAAASEGKLASLQANMESNMRSRELTETRMMQALREEIASVERRAEEERAAHNATKMAAMEREVELEHRAAEASTALARIQRTVDERTARAAELEQKLALLEVECASLNQELQDMETRARHGQKKASEEANQALQFQNQKQAWQEEVERARHGQRDAETKLSSLEAEVQKMRVEMAGMKRDAEHYSRQEHMELEKRYRELTDLLYYKQTQLEAMASEKAAAEFQLEKEAKRLQEVQVEAERSRSSRRASSSWEEDTDLKALEPLPLHHRHMAGASMQLQRAAKFLDSGAVRATKFLWRYPIARVILLFYLVFVHLFLMYLLHRLQEQADNFASKEVAASMGLGKAP